MKIDTPIVLPMFLRVTIEGFQKYHRMEMGNLKKVVSVQNQLEVLSLTND
jgi:hypothetical protein